jgi:hypothetical protein
MGRHHLFKNALVVSTRFNEEDYKLVQEIADLESARLGKYVSAQELIRNAVQYVYGDNERLRECFRRSRRNASIKFRKKG